MTWRSRFAGASALLLVALAGSAGAQDVAPAGPASVAAAPAGSLQGGKATIRCIVADRARLEGCVVVSEEPVGGGFGQMALDASGEMRFRGPGAKGGTVVIPMTFKASKKVRQR